VFPSTPAKQVLGPHRRETFGGTKDLWEVEVVRGVVEVGRGNIQGRGLHGLWGQDGQGRLRVSSVQFPQHILRRTPSHPMRGEQCAGLGGVASLKEGKGVATKSVSILGGKSGGEMVVCWNGAGPVVGGCT
jgi:hypothetical protein